MGWSTKGILDAAREQRIQLFTSPALLAELEDVLGRDKDLLDLGSFENIRILAAASALPFIAGKSD